MPARIPGDVGPHLMDEFTLSRLTIVKGKEKYRFFPLRVDKLQSEAIETDHLEMSRTDRLFVKLGHEQICH